MRVPHRIHAEVLKESGLQPNRVRPRGDLQKAQSAQGDRDNREAPYARPRPYAARDTAEVQRGQRDGLPEGQELTDDLRPAREHEVQVRQPEVLVGRLLRVGRRPERGDASQVDTRAGVDGHSSGPAEREGVRGPVLARDATEALTPV